MINIEILKDLKNKLDEYVSENRLELTLSDYTLEEIRNLHQEYLIKCLENDGVYEYTNKLTEQEIDNDFENRNITNQYVKYLKENEL